MLLHQIIKPSADSPGSPAVPLICMPSSAGDGRAIFDRLAAAAEAHLTFPALLVAPDLSEPNAQEQWPAAFAKLRQQHHLTDRGLVFGHGAGARHAQHFALDHPDAVIACAALSADAWASVSDSPDPGALRPVRWLIGCGLEEPAGAMQRAERLQVELAEVGCLVDFLDWDGGPSELSAHALENTVRFFNDLQSAKQAA
ncbi:MAG: hypothetical protein AAF333_13005 [Planctomycetota bacterium]